MERGCCEVTCGALLTLLFRATRKFHPLGVHFILYGSDAFSEKDNVIFFGHVHQYIKNTKRFNTLYVTQNMVSHHYPKDIRIYLIIGL